MGKTAIQWCTHVLNFLRGCDAVSAGCAHCWAAATAVRFSQPGAAFDGLARRKPLPSGRGSLAVWTDKPVQQIPDAMLEALAGGAPRLVFVNSVSDTFHADVPFEYIAAWWGFMAASKHTFQIVTKRAKRMREFFRWSKDRGGFGGWIRAAADLCDAHHREDGRWAKAYDRLGRVPVSGQEPLALPNVWLLVSTENQETYDERVAELLQCPAVVRGISAEPLLGPIELGLGRWIRLPRPVVSDFAGVPGLPPPIVAEAGVYRARSNALGALWVSLPGGDLGIKPGEYELLPDLDWAIIGGESGSGCRPCELQWVRDLTYQISEYNRDREDNGYTAPFLKQLGGAAVDRQNGLVGALHPAKPKTDPWVRSRLRDGHGGDEAEFPASLCGYRHFPIPRTVRPVHLTVSPWVLLVALAFLVPWAAVMLEGRRSSRPLPPSAFGYVQ